jgi:hypothetical protein
MKDEKGIFLNGWAQKKDAGEASFLTGRSFD